MFRAILLLLLTISPAYGDGEKSGDFDYYVMSLSWTPSWCSLEGDDRNSPQCMSGKGHGFTLHGLWPQYSKGGWPSFCRSHNRQPSRAMTAQMADIMGTSGLAWHQWKKHGSCSGLSAKDYYALSRQAYNQIKRPSIFRRLKKDITLDAGVVEDAFMESNPNLKDNQITITCRSHKIQEVRICLTKELELTECAKDVSYDCPLKDAQMEMMR